jgi:hypothetical protein
METPDATFLLLPDLWLPKYVLSPADIYKHRRLLRQLLVNEDVLNHLLTILTTTVQSGGRFRTLSCLRVIRAILKNNPFDDTVAPLPG